MSRLANIVASKRSQGSGVTSALAGGIKERLKEKFDPRQLINQQGLLTALFPGLRTYSASTSKNRNAGSSIESSSIDVTDIKPIFEKIQYNTTLSAKNLSVLPSIHRDFNVIRQNIVKLLKMEKVDAATKADMYFKAAAKREELYEAQLNRLKNQSKTPTKIAGMESKQFNKFMKLMKSMLFFGVIAGSLYFAFKGISDAIDKLRKVDLRKSLESFIQEVQEGMDKLMGSLISTVEKIDTEDLKKSMEQNIKELGKNAVPSGLSDLITKKYGKDSAPQNFDKWWDEFTSEKNSSGGANQSEKKASEAQWEYVINDNKNNNSNKELNKVDSNLNQQEQKNQSAPTAPSPKTPLEEHNYITQGGKGGKNAKGGNTPIRVSLGPNVAKYKTIGSASDVSGETYIMPLAEGTINDFPMEFLESRGRPHYGLDLGTGGKVGLDVVASAGGKVTFAGHAGKYGNVVQIEHPSGTRTVYAHLSKILVDANDPEKNQVKAGQVIGKSGGAAGAKGSGNSSGPHLHFEIINKHGQALNPVDIIRDLKGKKLKEKVIRTTPLPDQSSVRIIGSDIDMISSSNFVDDLINQIPIIIIGDNKKQSQNMIVSEETDSMIYVKMLYSNVISRSSKIL
jgi:murein DD-endopeptidase MepM/ murein hydrolase activator NlpD